MKLFKDLPDKDTAINAENLNQIQNNLTIVSSTEPTGDNREKVWIQKGKNLIAKFYAGSYYNQNTNKIENSINVCRTDYIEIKTNVDYIFSHSFGEIAKYGWIHCFDINHNFIQTINQDIITSSFNVSNENVKYIMISIYNENYLNETWMQLEQGSVATEYEPYIEKKIFVKNDNDVYEEFVNIEQVRVENATISVPSISGGITYIVNNGIATLNIRDLTNSEFKEVGVLTIATGLPPGGVTFLIQNFNSNIAPIRLVIDSNGDLKLWHSSFPVVGGGSEFYGQVTYKVV